LPQKDLINLGAKYSPCMRLDPKLNDFITQERNVERNSACCVRNDNSGCIQLNDCPVSAAECFSGSHKTFKSEGKKPLSHARKTSVLSVLFIIMFLELRDVESSFKRRMQWRIHSWHAAVAPPLQNRVAFHFKCRPPCLCMHALSPLPTICHNNTLHRQHNNTLHRQLCSLTCCCPLLPTRLANTPANASRKHA